MTLLESMGEAGCGMIESHSADWLTHTNIYIYENRSYLLSFTLEYAYFLSQLIFLCNHQVITWLVASSIKHARLTRRLTV